jgi:hypothetical protein
MKYECIYSQRDKGWVVEAIHDQDEGQISRVLFTGESDEQLAREYARWKNASTQPQGERLEHMSAG